MPNTHQCIFCVPNIFFVTFFSIPDWYPERNQKNLVVASLVFFKIISLTCYDLYGTEIY